MQTQEIEVTIQPDGSTKLHVRGVAGATCLTLTEELIRSLGGQVIAHKKLRNTTNPSNNPTPPGNPSANSPPPPTLNTSAPLLRRE